MSDSFRRLETNGRVMINVNQTVTRANRRRPRWAVVLSVSLLALGDVASGRAAQPGGESFASPERAVAALAGAWHGGRAADLLAIFGPSGQKLVTSGDPVAERNARRRLAASYDQRHRIERGAGGEAILVIGNDEWPYPIPLVRQGSGWRFDVKAGAEQILDRRIGRDELNAIAVSRAYVVAQREYAAEDPMHSGLHEYAQQVASSDGRRDGLYWPVAAGDRQSPLGPLVATAEAKGYPAPPATAGGRSPFEGYDFRILTRQGPQAPGGAKSYVVNGHMTGGFALVAYPDKWGDSGVMTFLVNQNGIVFEKNLGPDTASAAREISAYDPDRSWKIAQP
ncbi:MAG TPA: DUF2950 domain-containing protein [Caulobacteraceae bacterium]|nr:DUF2950 domain-containing protein [Caulobacteraceae bacterium]